MQRPSILQLEQAFLSAWPALKTQTDKGWIWRWADGYTKRANSAQSLDPSDDEDAAARLAAYSKWAEEQGVTPTFRVTPLAGAGVVSALNLAGWATFEPSVVMAMPVGAVFAPKHDYRLFSATDPEWYETQGRISGYGEETIAALKALLDHIEVPATGILVYDEAGAPAAAALTSNNHGIGVYLNVVVREDVRMQGYGRSVMQAALEWSRSVGAGWAAIQVVADNTPALQLYKSLGFEVVYRYHYRRPSQMEHA